MDTAATHVFELAANLDDVSGELVGDAIDRLLGAGALDAWATPITMKKNRPALTLSVLCREEDRGRLAEMVIELTGTFGVRFRSWDRLVLDRRHATVQTAYGPIRVKVGSLDGRDVVSKVEHDDAAAAAREAGVALRAVVDAAVAAYGTARAAKGGDP